MRLLLKISLVLFSVCGTSALAKETSAQATATASYATKTIATTDKAKTAVSKTQTQNHLLIDVREKSEVDEGMIEGAHWIPLSRAEKEPEAVKAEIKRMSQPGQTVQVYCRSGGRAGKFIRKMSDPALKFENLGGYEGLVKSGLKTQKLAP